MDACEDIQHWKRVHALYHSIREKSEQPTWLAGVMLFEVYELRTRMNKVALDINKRKPKTPWKGTQDAYVRAFNDGGETEVDLEDEVAHQWGEWDRMRRVIKKFLRFVHTGMRRHLKALIETGRWPEEAQA